jgi:hypothetical protein
MPPSIHSCTCTAQQLTDKYDGISEIDSGVHRDRVVHFAAAIAPQDASATASTWCHHPAHSSSHGASPKIARIWRISCCNRCANGKLAFGSLHACARQRQRDSSRMPTCELLARTSSEIHQIILVCRLTHRHSCVLCIHHTHQQHVTAHMCGQGDCCRPYRTNRSR